MSSHSIRDIASVKIGMELARCWLLASRAKDICPDITATSEHVQDSVQDRPDDYIRPEIWIIQYYSIVCSSAGKYSCS